MTTHPIITNLITLMNKICRLKEAGANVIHSECITDLSWVWRDKDTDRVIDTVKLSRIKAIMHLRKSDPRVKYLFAFAAGADPIAVRDKINRLNNLKAFW
jgi:hypothetical protein